MNTRAEVAKTLNVTENHLCRVLYGAKLRTLYHDFDIRKKSGKTRRISAPPIAIKSLQERLLIHMSLHYEPKPCVHGFAPGRSIVSNAIRHTRRRHVVNIDLKDFFPSIHIGRVVGLFQKHPFRYGKEAAETLAQICCRADGELPQGGVTSPIISNLVCRAMDNDLMLFARRCGLTYSRYADDLTFSTNHSELPDGLVNNVDGLLTPGDEIDAIIRSHKFEINRAKVTRRDRTERQSVTGITVNNFPNIRRSFVRKIEGALHAWAKYGYDAALTTYRDSFTKHERNANHLDKVIRGRLAYLKMVRGSNDFLYRRLVRRFNVLCSQDPIGIDEIGTLRPTRLHNTIPQIGGWKHWADMHAGSVFLLEIKTPEGDIHCGSGFHVGHGIIATAAHNVVDSRGATRQLSLICGENRISPAAVRTAIPNSDKIDVAALRVDQIAGTKIIPTQLRLPEIGEEVAAVGFPRIPQRNRTMVMHVGTVEALPTYYDGHRRFIQVSFQSGGGLSGGCLIDKAGFVVGVMIENVFMGGETTPDCSDESTDEGDSASEHQLKPLIHAAPARPYGQAVPIEYFDAILPTLWHAGASAMPIPERHESNTEGYLDVPN